MLSGKDDGREHLRLHSWGYNRLSLPHAGFALNDFITLFSLRLENIEWKISEKKIISFALYLFWEHYSLHFFSVRNRIILFHHGGRVGPP